MKFTILIKPVKQRHKVVADVAFAPSLLSLLHAWQCGFMGLDSVWKGRQSAPAPLSSKDFSVFTRTQNKVTENCKGVTSPIQGAAKQ